MRAAGQDDEAIRAFARAYQRLEGGESAYIATADLEPATDVPTLEDLGESAAAGGGDGGRAAAALDRVALIKLNGGLATTMGLRHPKSLVEVREGLTFLELIIRQTVALRRRFNARLPLLLMDSDATRADTLAELTKHPELTSVEALGPDFLQSMIPKLDAETLEPVSWAAEPALEWCPPGHGDVYGALRRSGMLASLLAQGFEYAMISNSDNLGTTIDPRLVSYLDTERVPFLMEVVIGTKAARKGGHIARRLSDSQLILREAAQTPPGDEDSFGDYRHWRFYNTNNLWVSLPALSSLLDAFDGVLELPLIVNRKTVDPRNPKSTVVLQLESAMGAAIGSFPGARIMCVPQTRFAPVKTTDDLLVLRSDVYRISDGSLVEPIPERAGALPFVELDPAYYKLMDEFESRFASGPPSLREAERLVVHGDVRFEAGVVVKGAVEIDAPEPRSIEAGSVLAGE